MVSYGFNEVGCEADIMSGKERAGWERWRRAGGAARACRGVAARASHAGCPARDAPLVDLLLDGPPQRHRLLQVVRAGVHHDGVGVAVDDVQSDGAAHLFVWWD